MCQQSLIPKKLHGFAWVALLRVNSRSQHSNSEFSYTKVSENNGFSTQAGCKEILNATWYQPEGILTSHCLGSLPKWASE